MIEFPKLNPKFFHVLRFVAIINNLLHLLMVVLEVEFVWFIIQLNLLAILTLVKS